MFWHPIPELNYPQHATFRTLSKNYFPIPLQECWEAIGDSLNCASKNHGLKPHACVLMSNHFHLLFSPADQAFSGALTNFTQLLEKTIRPKIGLARTDFRLGATWQPIHQPTYFGRTVKYMYRNPIRAGLCNRVEEYPYSTIHADLGRAALGFPRFDCYFGLVSLPHEEGEMLTWLNSPYSEREEWMIGQ